jgi:hypothetical protein
MAEKAAKLRGTAGRLRGRGRWHKCAHDTSADLNATRVNSIHVLPLWRGCCKTRCAAAVSLGSFGLQRL